MGYQKNSDDNGRVGGIYDSLTTEHIMSKTEYFKYDKSANQKEVDNAKEWEENLYEEVVPKNDTKEIITEVTETGNKEYEVNDNDTNA